MNPNEIIKKLVETGVINEEMGKEILKNLPKSMDSANFAKADEHKAFLSDRDNLNKYLVAQGVVLDEDEFEKIRALVMELEEQAIARFKASLAEGDLNSDIKAAPSKEESTSRDEAINRLNVASSRPKAATLEIEKKFTLEDIGKMSPKEFKANEAQINKQLREGSL